MSALARYLAAATRVISKLKPNAHPHPERQLALGQGNDFIALHCATEERRERLSEISAHLEFSAVTQHHRKLPIGQWA